jgi:hypothetical protein
LTINTQDDLAFDAWVDLVARPGKKDKKVKGQIHLQWNVRFLKNFVVNPATEWPDYSLITIEPIPYLNYIEIMVREPAEHTPPFELLRICFYLGTDRRFGDDVMFGRLQDSSTSRQDVPQDEPERVPRLGD